MTNKVEVLVCSICRGPIDAIGEWKGGHNAQPVNAGRCCTQCNNMVVIPVRLRRMQTTGERWD